MERESEVVQPQPGPSEGYTRIEATIRVERGQEESACMGSQAGSELHPLPERSASELMTGNVSQNEGNTAIGNNIQQQYHYYNKYIEREMRENELAKVIKAVAQLILAAGYVVALLTSLIMLLRLVGMVTGG